jgi:hypothetical protein
MDGWSRAFNGPRTSQVPGRGVRGALIVGGEGGCSGRLELEDLLVGVVMGPLLEERPHRRG